MDIHDINLSNLDGNDTDQFLKFARAVSEVFERAKVLDRERNSDHHGNYEGSFEPERTYVSSIMAFIDEYDLEINLVDTSEIEDNAEFYKSFGRFKARIDYSLLRFRLRQERGQSGPTGTATALPLAAKEEVAVCLEKIRKIVVSMLEDGNKRDRILAKIATLQLEIDRDRTTIDAVFSKAIALSTVIGESADKLDPAVKLLERIKEVFWKQARPVPQLPKPERPEPKGIEDKSGSIDDDEIPF